MARGRKSVLGENPFAASGESPARGSTTDGEKPRKRSSKKAKAPKTDRDEPSRGVKPEGTSARKAASRGKAKTVPKPAAKKPVAKKPAQKKPVRKRVAKKKAPAEESVAGVTQTRSPSADKPTPDTQVAAGEGTGLRETPRMHDEQQRRLEKQRIAEEIRRLENRQDADVGQAPEQGRRDATPAGSAGPLGIELPGAQEGGMFETARSLLSSDYYLRQWGRLGMRNRSAEVDDFGHDIKYDARFQPLLDVLYERYFRVETEGIENVPAEGRALIVANHGGTFPYDGVMLKTAVRREHPAARNVRWLTEDHLFYMPFVGSFLNRMGAVRACQENAQRLLRHEHLVAVFPEGAKGTGRLYRNRHKLQRFGRGGFIRLCLRTQTPVIPCVIVGAEESMPLLFRIEYLANLLGIPYIPVTPTFPALGPLGVLPAPTKWQFVFGAPISFERYGPDAADDHVLVRRLTERVRATMQGMIEQAAASRRSPWFG